MTTSSLPESPRAAAPRPRGTGLLIALAGALSALAYGHFVAGLGLGAPLVILALGGLTLGLVGLAFYRAVDPLLQPEGATAPAATRAPVRRRELEREKQLVLKTIRELEHDFQMRKISEQDYKEMTARYRARAMRLLREMDAGDDYRTLIEQELKTRLVALQATRRSCPICRAANEPDAVYCKTCGKPLAAAEAPRTAGEAAVAEPAADATASTKETTS